MIRVARGAAPAGFAGRAADWERRFAVGRREHAKLSASAFWSRVRNEIKADAEALRRRFHGKCAFCEAKMEHVANPHIEHYRPKNAVWTVRNPGSEREDLVNVRGRTYNKDFESGYWWLTYSWDNYLVSCPTCNQKWKSAVFPIAQVRSGPPVVGDETSETPLLLDPFGTESPSTHLAFDSLGQIEAYQNSVIGMKTIETCGLDRESLRSDRQEKAARAWRLLKRLLSSVTEPETQEILQDFREMGRIEYAHCGMVRSIFEQSTGMSWSQLDVTGPSV